MMILVIYAIRFYIPKYKIARALQLNFKELLKHPTGCFFIACAKLRFTNPQGGYSRNIQCQMIKTLI